MAASISEIGVRFISGGAALTGRDPSQLQKAEGQWVRVVDHHGNQWIGVLTGCNQDRAKTSNPPHGGAPRIWRHLQVGHGHDVNFSIPHTAAVYDANDNVVFGSAALADRFLELRRDYPRAIVRGSARRARAGGWMLPGVYYATPSFVEGRRQAGFDVEVVPANSRKLSHAVGLDHTKSWSGDITGLLQKS